MEIISSELIVIKGRVDIVDFYGQPDILDRVVENFTEMQAWDPFFEVEGQLGLVYLFEGQGREIRCLPTYETGQSIQVDAPNGPYEFEIERIQNEISSRWGLFA